MRSLPAPPILLDTHAWVWTMEGAGEIGRRARGGGGEAAPRGAVLVSVISVWEVAMLEAKGRVRFTLEIGEWVRRALAAPGVRLAELTPEIAIDSTRLPGGVHGDPADRILVATARRTGAALVTRDERLLELGAAGVLAVVDAGR
jgi:PIN domain nuclease of toxin-antitoxin system